MSSSHAALIVDADSKGLESLVYGFQGAEWRITPCPTPETASLLVKASGAEIVVVASRTDHEKAHALIRQLRGKEAFRTLPVLVLGPEELRNPLKERGDVDLLPLPTFVRDVLTASQLLVAASATAALKPGEEPVFATDITTMTTLSLVRTMNGLARSGLLHLERKGRHGEILFHEGELTAAQVGQLQGMAAVQHVLIWNDGALQLHLRPVVRRGQLHQTAQEFLEEFDRFQRDFTHAIKDIGPPVTVYARNEGLLLHSAGAVPAEVTPVVRLCEGQRTLSDIIDESPFRVLDTVRILGRLVDLGILVRRDPKPEGDGKALRTPLEEFWETARIVGPPTPHAPHARIGGTPVPVHESSTPAAQAGRPAEPEPESEGNVHHAEATRPRKQTLEMPTPAPADEPPPAAVQPAPPAPPTTQSSSSGPAHAPLAPLPVTPKAPLGAQASGTIEIGKRARRTQPTMRAVEGRASVVVDIPQVDAATAPKSTSGGVPVQAAMKETSSGRIAGVMQVSPSRKTAHQVPAAARITIQLDASLAPDQDKANAATKPVGESKSESSGTRMTGEMHVTPSGRTGRVSGRMESSPSSFHIDPSLTAEAPTAAGDAQARPSGSQPAVAPSEKRHQSGNFSPIEKDIFEREAELYKVEQAESFADLEEKRAKQAAKNGGGGKGDKRNRK